MAFTAEQACGHPMYRRTDGECACPKCDPTHAAIREVYADLLARQEPLGADFEKVWDDNMVELLER